MQIMSKKCSGIVLDDHLPTNFWRDTVGKQVESQVPGVLQRSRR
jgi:hypothetical protein